MLSHPFKRDTAMVKISIEDCEKIESVNCDFHYEIRNAEEVMVGEFTITTSKKERNELKAPTE